MPQNLSNCWHRWNDLPTKRGTYRTGRRTQQQSLPGGPRHLERTLSARRSGHLTLVCFRRRHALLFVELRSRPSLSYLHRSHERQHGLPHLQAKDGDFFYLFHRLCQHRKNHFRTAVSGHGKLDDKRRSRTGETTLPCPAGAESRIAAACPAKAHRLLSDDYTSIAQPHTGGTEQKEITE